ncbi:MAG: ATP phosphoribosyltransferase regulatory subunit [Eubacteriales bacterium]|nr:ATP phosphoribosyltransferase regulatory subunit [Eubacteriales bacterium]
MEIKVPEISKKEKAMFALRALYASHGFSMFRMTKFESFDLYAANRDFMDSTSIITFTDTDGMLMALKPDVTLSIVKNNRHIGNDVRKIYYNENVYRVSPKTHYFQEIMQVGLECLGRVDEKCICEVLRLAAESLRVLSDKAILDISNLDILSQLIASCRLPREAEEAITRRIGEKNVHGLESLCAEYDIGPAKTELLKKLINIYGKPCHVLPQLEEAFCGKSGFAQTEGSYDYIDSINRLRMVVDAFQGTGLEDMINIDFSVVNDLKYYNGIVFKGFIQGVPDRVLSGGQYDKLMDNINRKSRAIGFDVYMDDLGKLAEFEGEEVIIRG